MTLERRQESELSRRLEGSEFQVDGPAYANALPPYVIRTPAN